MIASSIARVLVTGMLLGGAALFLYIYHVHTRQFDSSDRPRVTDWRFYVWIDWYLKLSTLIITVLSIHSDSAWLLRFHRSPLVLVIGLVISGTAIGLFVWAMKSLGAQFTPAHQSHLPDRIVREGPYRYIRHPIYTSNLLLITGLLLASGSLWIVLNLIILIGYYVPTILVEERALRVNIPGYTEYAESTGRFFPRVSSFRSVQGRASAQVDKTDFRDEAD